MPPPPIETIVPLKRDYHTNEIEQTILLDPRNKLSTIQLYN